MTSTIPRVRSGGFSMPQLGLGCMLFDLLDKGDDIVNLVGRAIDVGYRHFDIAHLYLSEEKVGRAIKTKIAEGVITREDIFLTSKLPPYAHEPRHTRAALERTLKDLAVEYVDLYLIHTPFAYLPTFEFDEIRTVKQFAEKRAKGVDLFNGSDLVRTWKILEEYVNRGLIKSLGLSNFNSNQIQLILDNCDIKPVNNQIESHPFFNNSKMIKYCHENDICVTAYASFGVKPPYSGFNGKNESPLECQEIQAIARKHSKTPAQVLLRFQIERNVAVIPRTSNFEHLKGNIEVFDFTLDEEDMDMIYSLDKNERLFKFIWAKEHKEYPFCEEL